MRPKMKSSLSMILDTVEGVTSRPAKLTKFLWVRTTRNENLSSDFSASQRPPSSMYLIAASKILRPIFTLPFP